MVIQRRLEVALYLVSGYVLLGLVVRGKGMCASVHVQRPSNREERSNMPGPVLIVTDLWTRSLPVLVCLRVKLFILDVS